MAPNVTAIVHLLLRPPRKFMGLKRNDADILSLRKIVKQLDQKPQNQQLVDKLHYLFFFQILVGVKLAWRASEILARGPEWKLVVIRLVETTYRTYAWNLESNNTLLHVMDKLLRHAFSFEPLSFELYLNCGVYLDLNYFVTWRLRNIRDQLQRKARRVPVGQITEAEASIWVHAHACGCLYVCVCICACVWGPNRSNSKFAMKQL